MDFPRCIKAYYQKQEEKNMEDISEEISNATSDVFDFTLCEKKSHFKIGPFKISIIN